MAEAEINGKFQDICYSIHLPNVYVQLFSTYHAIHSLNEMK